MKITFNNVGLIFAAGCLGGHGFWVETCQGERRMNLPKPVELAQ